MGAVVPPRRILRRCARRFRTAVSAVPRIAPEVPRFVHHKRNGDAQNPDQETGYLRSGLRFASCPDRKSASPSRLRAEEHTSELQSIMRISYAVFCSKKKTHLISTLPYKNTP